MKVEPLELTVRQDNKEYTYIIEPTDTGYILVSKLDRKELNSITECVTEIITDFI